MRKKYNRVLAIMMAAVFAANVLVTTNTMDVQAEPETVKGACEYLNISNINSHVYDVYASVVGSYLVETESGQLMSVQYDNDKNLFVKYYDSDYNVGNVKTIPLEYDMFGGFHASGDAYFVVTGQKNIEESDEKEVYRITKYDKDWNEIGHCGLNGANTIIPFVAGSLRMADNGHNLLIRTCHEMYTSYDGLNHQANVTIEVNMDTMEITDQFTSVANVGVGYVSHSFNQFIKLDNDKIVAVDHGDAFPRSVCLTKYNKDVSDGHFYGTQCDWVDVLPFQGQTGENYTGGSVGGLEISDSKYLIAGNNAVEFGDYYTTRNVYIAAVDKETLEVELKYITNSKLGEASNSTPILVDMKNGYYLMLWNSDSDDNAKIFYAKLDSNGEQIGEIYSMAGNLSDCQPLAKDGKVIWYTTDIDVDTFYEIDTNNLSNTTSRVIKNGHSFDDYTVDNGVFTADCTRCGAHIVKNVITEFETYWGTYVDGYYRLSTNIPNINPGETLYYEVDNCSSNPVDDYNLVVEALEDDVKLVIDIIGSDGSLSGHVKFNKEGVYHIAVYPKFNPSIKKIYAIPVGDVTVPSDDISNLPSQDDNNGTNSGGNNSGDNGTNSGGNNSGDSNTNSGDSLTVTDSQLDGDVTCDGKVDLNDAKIVLKLALGIDVYVSNQGGRNADYDRNDRVDLNDARHTLKAALGIK